MKILFVILLTAITLPENNANKDLTVTVETEFGPVRGAIRYSSGAERPVYSFFGIKYGRCPDYLFRFRKPRDPWKWTETRDVSKEEAPPLCFQHQERLKGMLENHFLGELIPKNYTLSEDCLTLDIFTPSASSKIKMPVIAWIHGGSFQTYGSSRKLWAIPSLQNVVIVQMQYRLGPFGFYTSEDEWAIQNTGYHDQVKALQWIRNNIKNFGGDPNLVTLMGNSAGSLAVTAHMLSPMSKMMFHRAVALSGAIGSIPFDRDLLSLAKRVATRAGCDFKEPHSFTTCMQNKISSRRLIEACVAENAVFTNILGGDFMPQDPEILLKNQNFTNNVPLLIGVTNGENDFLLPHRYHSNFYNLGKDTTYDSSVQYISKILEVLHYPKQLLDSVINEYLGDEKDPISLHHGALDAFKDSLFVYPAHRFAKYLYGAGQKDVYFYEFSRKPEFYKNAYERPFPRDRADHVDDFIYIFGIPFIKDIPLNFTEDEKKFSSQLIEKLANFAKHGNPNVNSEDVKWSSYPSYVVFANDTMQCFNEEFMPRRMNLWKK